MSPVVGLLWAGTCYLLFQLVVSGLAALREGALDLVTLGAAEALAYVAVTLAVLFVHERRPSPRSSLGLRPTHPALALIGAGLGLSLKLPAESFSQVIERFFPPSDEQLLARAALYRTDTMVQLISLIAVVCLVAPLVEEMFFRGALYGRMAKISPRRAGVVTAAAFVAVHGNLRHWPALVVVASVLGYARVVSGSLLPCVCLHVAFNAAGVLALVTGAASPTRPLQASFLWLACSWAVVGLLLGALVRLSEEPNVVRARAEDRA